MNPLITPEIHDLMKADHYRPAVSVILPIEVKINLHSELNHALKIAMDKVKVELSKNYPDEICRAVMEKFDSLVQQLAILPGKKSIALFVSPVFAKAVYLDIAVEEKIIIDESFEIRDLLYSSKQLHNYLVLVLSNNGSRMYLANAGYAFIRVLPEYNESLDAYVNDVPERVLNFSDVGERKEILMDKFLHHVDGGLDAVLKQYRLPVFILCTDRVAGHFKKISRHGESVLAYIPGNYEEATTDQLLQLLEPYMAEYKTSKQDAILLQLQHAMDERKLVFGIKDVWREAFEAKGRLLVVEKNYVYPAQRGSHNNLIDSDVYSKLELTKMKDAVDEVIEQVLAHGGDVEFVENGVLQDYLYIAMVLYY